MKQKEELVPREQIPEATRILTNVAYLMGDVTSTLMLNVETRVERLGFGMKHGLKQRLKYALEATHRARRAWDSFAQELYGIECADDACECSDYYADIVLLIADRTGDNDEYRDKVRRALLRMKSDRHIYEQLQSVIK